MGQRKMREAHFTAFYLFVPFILFLFLSLLFSTRVPNRQLLLMLNFPLYGHSRIMSH